MKKFITFGIAVSFLIAIDFLAYAESPQLITLAIESEVAASSTTVMPVKYSSTASDVGQDTISNLANKEGNFTFQIESITAGSGWGDHSATFSVYYKTSLIDSAWEWTNAPANYIISDMAVSGNTTYPVTFYPEYTKNMRFYFVEKSGVSAFGGIQAKLQVN